MLKVEGTGRIHRLPAVGAGLLWSCRGGKAQRVREQASAASGGVHKERECPEDEVGHKAAGTARADGESVGTSDDAEFTGVLPPSLSLLAHLLSIVPHSTNMGD